MAQNASNSNLNAESTYESVGPSEIVYERKSISKSSSMDEIQKNFGEAPPLPPPLPPNPIKSSNHNFIRNSTDSLADSIDADTSLECSDSGMEVVEEPTLRPSELVRGNNNRSMSIISGMLKLFSGSSPFSSILFSV